jgi:Uncharacterized protein conserved in bacteria
MKAVTASALSILFGLLLWASPALADGIYDQCVKGTSTNTGWASCGAAYLKRLDNALNAAWKNTVSSLDGKSRAQLLREQQAWIKFKDASCQFYANGDFGREGQVVHYVECRAAIIEARISDLNAIYAATHQG